MKKLIYSLFVVAVFLASCKNNTTSSTEATDSSSAVTEEVSAVVDNVAQITINGDDKMKFDTDEIKVKAGQMVKLTLVHVGKLPKEAMGHNWVLLKAGVDLSGFAADAMKAKESDYIPTSKEVDVIAHTKLIGGGESTTIEFEAPAPGTYEFLCSFPGHSGMMKGHFIVE